MKIEKNAATTLQESAISLVEGEVGGLRCLIPIYLKYLSASRPTTELAAGIQLSFVAMYKREK